MVDATRILLAVALTFVVYKHALLWGRFFMNLHGMKSPAYVSPAYLHPGTRFASFPLFSVIVLVAIWLVWPYGHWGLAAILVAAYGSKSGSRRELVRHFVRQLLSQLENDLPFEEAWLKAEQTIIALTGVRNLHMRLYLLAPASLFRYAARTTRSRHEAKEIADRWRRWKDRQTTSELNSMINPGEDF